ncbi:tetratricopeptide repeat protein [Streptomyces sp. H27-C3]|uniref:tetratricopeptide repeat protein n=1 Tax=Streptomyces sp. H27-C3 TaxID=3046305 RepID=UPI0024B91799|nr:tetratricopeptide repeat protein [Streptomyces sp. H27-C3]MDJ0463718.1 tetratricopeptide repeat protein [Streptomyces sp. H27-C3]
MRDACAWALRRAGRARQALVHADQTLALGTRSAPFHYHRAKVHYALGDVTAARKDFGQAMAIDPRFHPLHATHAPCSAERHSMNLASRRTASGLVTALLVCASAVAAAPAATAHPLGNFTVNHYTGLTLHPGRIDALVVVDRAEIAAAQEHPLVDQDHNGRIDTGEGDAYASRACTALAAQLRVVTRRHP